MNTLLVVVTLFGFAVIGLADDLTLPDGQVFKDYQVIKTEPDGLTVRYSAGVMKLYFWELPEGIQKQHGYDPQKARQYNQKARAQQAAAVAQQQEAARRAKQKAAHTAVMETIKKGAIQMQGTVQQIMADGALISDARANGLTTEDEPVFVLGAGTGFTDGVRWRGTVYPAGTYRYTTVLGSVKSVRCFALSPDAALQHMLKNQ